MPFEYLLQLGMFEFLNTDTTNWRTMPFSFEIY